MIFSRKSVEYALMSLSMAHERGAMQVQNAITFQGKARQRGVGGGVRGTLPQLAQRVLFTLVYQKTNPLQTMHGLQFGLSQAPTNYWIHRL